VGVHGPTVVPQWARKTLAAGPDAGPWHLPRCCGPCRPARRC